MTNDQWTRRSRGYGTCSFAGGKGNCRQRQLSAKATVGNYFASNQKLSEWLLNSGAYMLSIDAMPVW
jgi:hypothetical protein